VIIGGRQERDLRGGTENVPAIIGLGTAAQAADRHLTEAARGVGGLRDRLESGICSSVPIARVNGQGAPRAYNTTNIGFKDIEAEAILLLLSESGVCASAGAACSSGSLEPSHVLRAMNVDPRFAHGAVRFSLSRFNTEQEVDRVIELLPTLLERLTVLNAP
jgi:cysteine desulfurase